MNSPGIKRGSTHTGERIISILRGRQYKRRSYKNIRQRTGKSRIKIYISLKKGEETRKTKIPIRHKMV